jgi:hypothetical protein
MHNSLEIINDPIVIIGRKCINESNDYTVSVSLKSFIKHISGEPVRQAFPNLKKSDYEFLERGTEPVVEETFDIEI